MRLDQTEAAWNDFGNKRHSFSHPEGQTNSASRFGTVTKTKLLVICDLRGHSKGHRNRKLTHIGREIAHC
jgi:hypothetical protein